MTELETMVKVTDELVRRGLKATCEYPGYVQVGPLWQFGTANGAWDGDRWASAEALAEGYQPVETVHSEFAASSDEAARIAAWIASVVRLDGNGVAAHREAMEMKFRKALALLWELCDDPGFNDAVSLENGGRYELGESFDEYVFHLGESVRFIRATPTPTPTPLPAMAKAKRVPVWAR